MYNNFSNINFMTEFVLKPREGSEYLCAEQVRNEFGYSRDYLNKLNALGLLKKHGTARKYYWIRSEIKNFINDN
jgi:hypothetical protein